MILKCLTGTLFGILSLFNQTLEGKIWGKVEAGPAYVHLDVLESNKTVTQLDMPAVRGDAVVVIGSGWCIKPSVLYGKNHGELTTVGLGVGHCVPLGECLIVTPTVGVTYFNLTTTLHIDLGEMGSVKFFERFYSVAPYLGIEGSYKIYDCLRLCGIFQWAWSHSHTKIKHLLSSKGDSNGPTAALILEYDFNQKWSCNCGAAYNHSLSKDKDGIRAWGAKMAIARWF